MTNPLILKDGGDKSATESIEFWHENRHQIGRVLTVEVCDDLFCDTDPENGRPVEYTLAAHGVLGTIYLSGCNCGSHPSAGLIGTVTILTELGVSNERAWQLVSQERVDCHFAAGGSRTPYMDQGCSAREAQQI